MDIANALLTKRAALVTAATTMCTGCASEGRPAFTFTLMSYVHSYEVATRQFTFCDSYPIWQLVENVERELNANEIAYFDDI